ncbi:hypothetical protein L1887_37766 [Cichorium endivia]|nr:hypothetical protein L1887_37766 [Cichorium endivia]
MISSAAPSPPPRPPTYSVIKNKKTSSTFLIYSKHHKRRQVLFTNKNRKRSETTKNSKNKYVVDRDDKVFSVMLPKGNVPPSGSSSCHNDYPNSVASLCALSSRKPQNIEDP